MEKKDRAKRKSNERQEGRLKRLRDVAMVKLEAAVVKKKQQLRKDIIWKRNILTSELTVKVQVL